MIDPLGIDLYTGDRVTDLTAYVAAGPPWHFAVMKISEGTHYQCAAWAHRMRLPLTASPRYGHDLFDAFYAFLRFDQDGARQIDFAWSMTQLAGGELAGTLPLMLDVERGGQTPGLELSQARVETVTRAAAARYEQLSGRKATLYGGELLRSIGATSLLGCGRSAVALYGSELHGKGETTAQFLARTGTDLEHLMLWQYVGAETRPPTGPAGYPHEAPGCGQVDVSALVLPGGLEALRSLLRSP